MKRAILSKLLPLAASVAIVTGVTAPVSASERDRAFFQSIEGSWAGAGEIVAGKYKGTKFNCTFAGTTPAKKLGMALDGGCRVGVFMQKMSASVIQNRKVGYTEYATYSGTIADPWSRTAENSAFYGTFTY